MQLPNRKQVHPYIEIALVVAALVVAVLFFLFALQYRYIRQMHAPVPHQSFLSAIHAHRAMTVSDVASVQPWMTFDYIDHLFSLPSSYLQTTLGITDTQYPNITIAHYAHESGVTQTAGLTSVQNAIRAHFAPQQ